MSNSKGKATVSDIYEHLRKTTNLGHFVDMYMYETMLSESKKRGVPVRNLTVKINESRALRDAYAIGDLWESMKEVLSKHLTLLNVSTTENDTHCVPFINPSKH